jgi:hypothetical protein
MTPITSCCFTEDFLVTSHEPFHSLTVWRHRLLKFEGIYQTNLWSYPVPTSVLHSSHSLILVSKSNTSAFRLLPTGALVHIRSEVFPYDKTRRFTFSVYDDALLLSNGAQFRLLDIAGTIAVCIGDAFAVPPGFRGAFDSQLAVAGGRLWSVRPNYESIASGSSALIAALFRRSDGLLRAIELFKDAAQSISRVQDLYALVDAIGPSARSRVAQIRFTRAIQFAGITNPHMILLGLLRYQGILGADMIHQAQIPLLEAMFHPACRHGMRDFFVCSGHRLVKEAIRQVIRKFGDAVKIPAEAAAQIDDYIEVCEDFGLKKDAARARQRIRLDRP